MGMANIGPYPDDLEKGKHYSLSCFNGIRMYLDRDIRRQKICCRIILSAGVHDGVVSAVSINPCSQHGLMLDKEDEVLTARVDDFSDIGREMAKIHIPIEERFETHSRIKDLKERIIFLENILYGVLKVDPAKVEGLRKIRE